MNYSAVTDTCVVGAGVIGLAAARQIALSGREVLVLEQGPRPGEGISSRNSEVIHAGIYYPRGSLKASLCVQGKELLYDYCETHKVGYRRIGKLIVATTPDEEDQLAGIQQKAEANGVMDLKEVSAVALTTLEPAVAASLALLSPSTGIISAHELMTAFLAEIESQSGMLATRAQVLRIIPESEGFVLECRVDGESFLLKCRAVINAAGLGAQSLASTIDGLSAETVPALHLCKGNYFAYRGASPFSHLIYPVPEPLGAGLGVHATLDLGNQVKFGPDVEYIPVENYDVSEQRLTNSIKAIRKYFPSMDPSRLVAGYAGIRPKLQGPGEPFADFVIQGADVHGIPGLVNLFGIESPGLTSSMAIAETVAAHLDH